MNAIHENQPSKESGKPMTIFLVEDSALVRERLFAMVSELRGAEIAGWAADAKQATERIESIRPDVVILDIHLSGGNGLKVLREVKRMQPAPVAIMLTNHATPEYRQACRQAGAEEFLDKSSETDRLVDILTGMIRQCGRLAPVLTIAPRRSARQVERSTTNREFKEVAQS